MARGRGMCVRTAAAAGAMPAAVLIAPASAWPAGDEAEKLAAAVLEAMAGSVTLLPTQPHRRANFRVLKAPEIPSILVELGYLSNAGDRRRMASQEWRERMAAALARGIHRWSGIASPGFLAPRKSSKKVARHEQKP